MRISKVYTRTGDRGTTSLADGSRVSKTDLRIDAYGTVDELNAVVGQVVVLLTEADGDGQTLGSLPVTLVDALSRIQHDLFNIGGDLATPVEQRFKGMVLVGEREPAVLEHLMDAMSEQLPPLRDFVLPGGSAAATALHLARTVCRRAERRVVELSTRTEINPAVLVYLNRLSDFFFVASRWVVVSVGQSEVTWRKDGGLAGLDFPRSV